MNPTTLVEQVDRLVSLPDVCIRVNQLMDSPNYSASRVGEIISQDTDLSARLLRLVNSSFYGLRSKIDTISRAVALVGTAELRNLVMATTAVRTFNGIPDDLVNMSQFWRHAVMTGVMARILATRCNVLHCERLFVMGVLHDVGRLAMYLTIPEKAREILMITGGDDWVLAEAEQELLGFTHMDVGAELMRAWGLPDGLIAAAGTHHKPSQAGAHELDVSLVHIALAAANGEMVGLSVDEMLWAIEPSAWEATGLGPELVGPSIEEMSTKTAEIMNLIVAQPARMHG